MSLRVGAGVALIAGALLLLGPAQLASAKLDGPCEASGTWQNGGFTVDARAIGSEVVTVPLEDTVAWSGSVQAVQTPRAVSGAVSVDLPWPLGEFTVDSWSGSGSETAKSGVEEYELPSLIPRGITFKVQGTHTEEGGVTCTGYVNLKVEGGKFASPVVYVAIALTLASGAAAAGVLVPIFRRVA